MATHQESECRKFCLFYYSIIVPQSDEWLMEEYLEEFCFSPVEVAPWCCQHETKKNRRDFFIGGNTTEIRTRYSYIQSASLKRYFYTNLYLHDWNWEEEKVVMTN